MTHAKKINANISYSYKELLPEEDKLYSNIIQTNFRSFSSNTVDLRYIKTNQLGTKFKYYDFFKRTTITLEGNYLVNEGNYFTQSVINQELSVNSKWPLIISDGANCCSPDTCVPSARVTT